MTNRTAGMTVVAIISIVFGLLIAVGNTIEVVQGQTFDGMAVTPLAGTLGLIGAAAAALLFLSGIGTWTVRPWGRTLALVAAVVTIVVQVVATFAFDFGLGWAVVGSLYPIILLVIYNRPGWKEAFGA